MDYEYIMKKYNESKSIAIDLTNILLANKSYYFYDPELLDTIMHVIYPLSSGKLSYRMTKKYSTNNSSDSILTDFYRFLDEWGKENFSDEFFDTKSIVIFAKVFEFGTVKNDIITKIVRRFSLFVFFKIANNSDSYIDVFKRYFDEDWKFNFDLIKHNRNFSNIMITAHAQNIISDINLDNFLIVVTNFKYLFKLFKINKELYVRVIIEISRFNDKYYEIIDQVCIKGYYYNVKNDEYFIYEKDNYYDLFFEYYQIKKQDTPSVSIHYLIEILDDACHKKYPLFDLNINIINNFADYSFSSINDSLDYLMNIKFIISKNLSKSMKKDEILNSLQQKINDINKEIFIKKSKKNRTYL
jgi:hypothetical protein